MNYAVPSVRVLILKLMPLIYSIVDIWDGEDGPVIFHGHTLTSKIPLADVARAIAKYAFVASPYPVVISAEIHCNLEQQDMAAEVMKREFGEALVTSPVDGEEDIQGLPSPERLKHRILLKVPVMHFHACSSLCCYLCLTEVRRLQAKHLYATSNAGEALPQLLDPVDSAVTEISSAEASNSDLETVKGEYISCPKRCNLPLTS